MSILGRWKLGVAIAWGVTFILTAALGGMTYFHFGDPKQTCASCHEMGKEHAAWASSGHKTLACRNCHGGSLTLDAHALHAHLNRVVQHFTREPAKQIKLGERDMLKVMEACRNCHPQAYADWQSGPHATTYARMFLNPEHNKKEVVSSDCLRCHGMFFEGDVHNLVAPLDKQGPWAMIDPAKASQPAIPCMACHQVHTQADDFQPARFYDRRDEVHFGAKDLPIVPIHGPKGPVELSLDPRQRLCVQCHAPSAEHNLGTSDDRTPTGVHEGLSCLDCHGNHGVSAKTSCSSCHPAVSNCGLDVEKMDTTFLSPQSRNNIHRVACVDCHPNGKPAEKSK